MIKALDNHPDVAMVYADQLISHTENETFDQCKIRNARLRRWPDYTLEDLMLRCITGSQPMWRKSLHDDLGVFDTNYRIAADYDMWQRFAEKHIFLRVPGSLGVLFVSPDTISGAHNGPLLNMEILAIQKIYINQAPWKNITGIRKRLATELFARGYQARPYKSKLPESIFYQVYLRIFTIGFQKTNS